MKNEVVQSNIQLIMSRKHSPRNVYKMKDVAVVYTNNYIVEECQVTAKTVG